MVVFDAAEEEDTTVDTVLEGKLVADLDDVDEAMTPLVEDGATLVEVLEEGVVVEVADV